MGEPLNDHEDDDDGGGVEGSVEGVAVAVSLPELSLAVAVGGWGLKTGWFF